MFLPQLARANAELDPQGAAALEPEIVDEDEVAQEDEDEDEDEDDHGHDHSATSSDDETDGSEAEPVRGVLDAAEADSSSGNVRETALRFLLSRATAAAAAAAVGQSDSESDDEEMAYRSTAKRPATIVQPRLGTSSEDDEELEQRAANQPQVEMVCFLSHILNVDGILLIFDWSLSGSGCY